MSNPVEKKKLFVSVVVPVYNGASRIGKTLESLMVLDYSLDRYEIVVVNNASTDNTVQIVESFVRRFKGQLRCINEPKQGLSHTRNKGIEEAKGDIISFTDDDCVVDPKWLSHVIKTFQDYQADAVLGKIVLATVIPENVWYPKWFLEERFAHVDYGNQDMVLTTQNMVGANMSYRKEVFDRYGKFDPDPIFQLCDDSEFSMRATKKGMKKVYCPNAVIFHHYDISRISEQKFFRQSFFWGRASIFMEPVEMPFLKYFLVRFAQVLKHSLSLGRAFLKNNRNEAFLAKCKIYSNWGRCYQLMQNKLRAQE